MPVRYIGHYFRTTSRLLIHPGRFFATMPRDGGMMMPLLFAVVTNWLAAAISFFWKVPLFQHLQRGYREGAGLWNDFAGDLSSIDSPGRHAESSIAAEAWVKFKELVLPWFWGASSVLLDPFTTLAGVFTTSILVFVAARVLVDSERPIRFRTLIRIVCFSSAAALWTVVPVVGALVAPIAMIATLTIALAEVYKTSFFRALTIAIFPKIAFVLLVISGVIAISWVAFRTLSALFGVS